MTLGLISGHTELVSAPRTLLQLSIALSPVRTPHQRSRLHQASSAWGHEQRSGRRLHPLTWGWSYRGVTRSGDIAVTCPQSERVSPRFYRRSGSDHDVGSDDDLEILTDRVGIVVATTRTVQGVARIHRDR
jgi:hypothetical protein